MRKIITYLLVMSLPIMVFGQEEKQSSYQGEMFTSIIPTSKQSLLKDVDVIFNTRFASDNTFTDGVFQNSAFQMEQFRFEVKGKIHDKVKFRFRNRYTKEPIPNSYDNMSKAVDLAYIDVEIGRRTNLTMGKLCADWGGYEFDFNPIDILAYNDLLNEADNFLTGAGIYHHLKGGKHSFSFQTLNSRSNTLQDTYGGAVPPSVTASKFPLAFVSNWRGSFFGGKFETTWSYSFFNDATHTNTNYFAFGNKFKPSSKFVIYLDFHFDNEALDRLGIVTKILNPNPNVPYAQAQRVEYYENWLRTEYLVAPKVNLLLTVMMHNSYWNNNPDPTANKLLQTSYGIIPTVQILPFKDMNIKFYVAYIGRRYDYTKYAEQAYGAHDYTTGQINFGFIAPLLVL